MARFLLPVRMERGVRFGKVSFTCESGKGVRFGKVSFTCESGKGVRFGRGLLPLSSGSTFQPWNSTVPEGAA
jgi:hypothetical protein